MQEFSKQLKEAGEGEESLKSISLAISILAVLVAMVTVLGHRTHTEAVLSQGKATDTWNQYQALRLRMILTENVDKALRLQPSSNAAAVEKQLSADEAERTKWDEQTKDLLEKARDFEADVKLAEHKASRYDIGEALLQIGVVLCSVTLFTRRKAYFFLGLGLGVAGLVAAATALLVR
jgi:hypothetical protein